MAAQYAEPPKTSAAALLPSWLRLAISRSSTADAADASASGATANGVAAAQQEPADADDEAAVELAEFFSEYGDGGDSSPSPLVSYGSPAAEARSPVRVDDAEEASSVN